MVPYVFSVMAATLISIWVVSAYYLGYSAGSPAKIKAVKKEQAWNLPDLKRVCTSHVERQNLNFRTFMRRMTRLSNGLSKKWENHEAMLALYIMHYNYCRPHGSLKTTPAVASGLENHKWTVREMIERTATT
jgi:hypothetical protein